MRVTLGYSPCPNDTFVFCGLVHGHIAGAPGMRGGAGGHRDAQ